MPTSTWVHISTVADEIYKQQPKTILDIGIGFGRWGLIARETLDVIKGKIFEESWQTRIDGVEIYEKYITDLQRILYNDIFITDVRNFVKNEKFFYDMIIAGDVIEHLPKKEALSIIAKLRTCCKVLIIGIPLGDKYKQGTVAGNTHEAHLSTWQPEDFSDCTKKIEFKERVKQRPYGLFIYESSNIAPKKS